MNCLPDDGSTDVFLPISTAIEKKAHLMKSATQDCMRIFHGRGKCFNQLDWLNIDYFTTLIKTW